MVSIKDVFRNAPVHLTHLSENNLDRYIFLCLDSLSWQGTVLHQVLGFLVTHDFTNSHEFKTNAEVWEDFDMLFLLHQHKDSSQLSLCCFVEVVVSQFIFLLHLLNPIRLPFCHNVFY